MTEIILKSKVEGLGAEADVVKVRPGYARNFLFPRGLAVMANSTNKRQIEALKQARATREAREVNEANEIAGRINKMTLTFQMLAGEGQQKVFGSVTSQDILERLAKEGVAIDKKRIRLPHPIKETGPHQVEIHLHPDVNASLKIVLEVPKHDADAEPKGRHDKPVRDKSAAKGERPPRARKS